MGMYKKIKIVGPEKIAHSCYVCPHFYESEFKDERYCKLKDKEIILRVGQRFPEWCPLPDGEIKVDVH